MAGKNDFFEIIEIPGKGLGCIATQDIPRGTTIIEEKGIQFEDLKRLKNGDKLKEEILSLHSEGTGNPAVIFNLNQFEDGLFVKASRYEYFYAVFNAHFFIPRMPHLSHAASRII